MRKPVVGVMGGGQASKEAMESAELLGRLIAQRGWILLNGGRNAGIMAASSRGAKEAGGFVVGVLPDADDCSVSPDLDLAIMTNMGDARNVINVLSSDVVIACEGREGTLSEVAIALKNGKRVVAMGFDAGGSLLASKKEGRLVEVHSAEQAIEQVKAWLAA